MTIQTRGFFIRPFVLGAIVDEKTTPMNTHSDDIIVESEADIDPIVDVDNNSQTAMTYAIRSIPTLIIVKNGSVAGQHIGAASKTQLENFINQYI